MKKVAIFKSDGGYKIGNGHVIRSLILARALKKKNIKCFFLNMKTNFFLNKLIKKEFKLLKIKRNSFNEIKKKINRLNRYYFVIDDFKFPLNLEKKISTLVQKIIVIEDFANKKHYADLIINQNLNRSKNLYKNKSNCKILAGVKYTLIDPSLKKIFKNKKKIIKNILICFGGFDGHQMNLKILKYLSCIERKFNINILISRADFYYKKINSYIKKEKINAKVHLNKNLLEIINTIDFAIISAGNISKEAIVLNIPSIVIATAKDQINNCIRYKNLKKIMYLGEWNKVSKETFIKKFEKILLKESNFINQKEKNNFFDFKGSERISKEIIKL